MLALNIQPAEKQDLREDGSLDVFKIWRTIQGEGPLAGSPAIFIRLAGCDLACRLCDTDYTSNRKLMSIGNITSEVLTLMNCWFERLVVITGGEPFRQNLVPLTNILNSNAIKVQIETNGTLSNKHFPFWKSNAIVVCSPKTGKVHRDIARYCYYKYILDAEHIDPRDGLPTNSMGDDCPIARPPREALVHYNKVYVQPLDVQDEMKNKTNLQAAIDSCMKFGYRLSLQQHKLLGLE